MVDPAYNLARYNSAQVEPSTKEGLAGARSVAGSRSYFSSLPEHHHRSTIAIMKGPAQVPQSDRQRGKRNRDNEPPASFRKCMRGGRARKGLRGKTTAREWRANKKNTVQKSVALGYSVKLPLIGFLARKDVGVGQSEEGRGRRVCQDTRATN